MLLGFAIAPRDYLLKDTLVVNMANLDCVTIAKSKWSHLLSLFFESFIYNTFPRLSFLSLASFYGAEKGQNTLKCLLAKGF